MKKKEQRQTMNEKGCTEKVRVGRRPRKKKTVEKFFIPTHYSQQFIRVCVLCALYVAYATLASIVQLQPLAW